MRLRHRIRTSLRRPRLTVEDVERLQRAALEGCAAVHGELLHAMRELHHAVAVLDGPRPLLPIHAHVELTPGEMRDFRRRIHPEILRAERLR